MGLTQNIYQTGLDWLRYMFTELLRLEAILLGFLYLKSTFNPDNRGTKDSHLYSHKNDYLCIPDPQHFYLDQLPVTLH